MAIREKIQGYKEERKRKAMLQLFARRPEIRREREEARLAALAIQERFAEAEAKYWKTVAERLDGTKDHLVLVTNFGGYDSVGKHVARAVKDSGLDTSQTVRMSVHTTKEMEERTGFEPYRASADSIAEQLGALGISVEGKRFRPETITGRWSAASKLREAVFWGKGDEKPQTLDGLHIAVVSALSMPQLNVSYEESLDGGAYVYRGTADDGTPSWEKLGKTSFQDRLYSGLEFSSD